MAARALKKSASGSLRSQSRRLSLNSAVTVLLYRAGVRRARSKIVRKRDTSL
jgi:hypothetical protein